jgi:carbon-monoxide dehydrogenase large subunit
MEITPGWENVEITMDPSGLVEARIGSSPHGQGLRTTLAQISADEIGIEPAQIRVIHGDTDRAPYGWGTFASRSLVIAGGASLIAARKLRTKLLTIASHMLEASVADIVLEAGVDPALPETQRCGPVTEPPRQSDDADADANAGDACERDVYRNGRLRSRRHLLQCVSRCDRPGRYRYRACGD